jgi:hypothetical protein
VSHLWYVAEWLATLVIQAWWWSGLLLRVHFRHRAVKAVYHELRPFYWPAVVLGYLCEVIRWHQPFDPINLWTLAAAAFQWWLLKDAGGDDDDRWKRRKARLAERVSEVGGRLTVVPAEVQP